MAGMTVREEVTILVLLFFFCVVTIPIIMLAANKDLLTIERENSEPLVSQFYRSNFRDKTAMDIVRIVESRKMSKEKVQIGVSILQNIENYEFYLKFNAILPKQKYLMKSSTEDIAKVWKKFNFKNKTLLTSEETLIPLKIDWRNRKVVTRVKQQSACGACWAYSTIGVIESMSAIKSGKLKDLSTAQMIECNDDEMDCKGGDPNRLLKWLFESRVNVRAERDFEKDHKCDGKGAGIRVVDYSLNDFTDNEHLMLLHLAHHGPLVAGVNSVNWLNYDRGIIQQNCSDKSKSINHAVEIVGYDMTGTVPHFIVKNSWGPHFGIDGYLKIAIGNNLCGIAESVSAVVVA